MAHRYPACVRFLTLAAALPWPAFMFDVRAAADSPGGVTPAVVSASDDAAVIIAVPTDRKPTAKRERIGLDGTALAVTTQPPIATVKPPSPWGVDAVHIAYADHPICAFLCRFLI